MSLTDTKRDIYRRKGGPISETYYNLATQLNRWEQEPSAGVRPRDIAALRSRLANVRKAIDAAEAAIAAALKASGMA